MKRSLALSGVCLLLWGCYSNDPILSDGGADYSSYDKVKSKGSSSKTKAALPFWHGGAGKRYKILNDGAPKGVIPTVFHEPKPKKEPLSRYGNPVHYQVDGHPYDVMISSRGYKTRGIASWYGMKFHKERTSSGEPYDMYAMTAAHKTLPLPTYVRVRNLKNGKQAIVKVNDRGPFHDDRVLDLSYAAAIKLGLLPKGTAPVEIEALTPAGGVPNARFYIQAGAFSTAALARALQLKLVPLTSSPIVVEVYDKRHVVRIGPFANRQMTDTLKKTLLAHGVNGAFAILG